MTEKSPSRCFARKDEQWLGDGLGDLGRSINLSYGRLIQLGTAIQAETGQTLVEYAVILAFVSLLLVGALTVLADRISGFLNTATSVLNGA